MQMFQDVKVTESDLMSVLEQAHCSQTVKDFYVNRIRKLNEIYSKNEVISKINGMISLLKKTGDCS